MAVSRAAAVSVRWYLIALLVGVAIVGGFWWQARGALYPVLPDTTTYLEMSRSFLRHGRFEVVPYALTTPAVTSAPTALWPPLYPIAIAALSVTGVRDLVAAPLINRVCFALLPVLLLWALAGAAHPRRIIAAAALALTAPGVLGVQFFGLSEGLTVVWLVLALGCALRTERSAMLLLSGLCSGAAYVTRNPALAVSAAIPLWLVFDAPSRADVPRRLLSWGLGAIVAVAPLLAYNRRLFGAIQPYAAAPSTTGLLENLRLLTVSVSSELIGARGADRWITGTLPSALALVALLGGAFALWRAVPRGSAGGRSVRQIGRAHV